MKKIYITLKSIIGFTLIWMAVDYNRPEAYRYSLLDWNGWIQLSLIVFGVFLIEDFLLDKK